MYFKQFYLACLAHASYLIGSEGEAAVIDPQRDVDHYIAEADAHGLKIKYVIETHLHADFVSGHRELAERTGAEIVIGEKAGATFQHRAVKEGDELTIGNVTLSVMETPGHTPESICLLITDTSQGERAKSEGEQETDSSARGPAPTPQKVLTGDTLFIGDVGRPDLAGGKGYTSRMMAEMMYDTLHEKLMKLPDAVEVYPAHGAGSMCGKNMSKETSSTIGEQKKTNYALKPMAKEDFVRMMTADLPAAPAYFPKDAEINRDGAPALADAARPAPLTPREVNDVATAGGVIVDVRSAWEYGDGHVPGALNIGLGGQFAIWAGSLISMGSPIVIVAETDDQVDEAVMRLARVGFESVTGYLRGGITAWREAGLGMAHLTQISVADLRHLIEKDNELQVLDVRRPPEYANGHVPQALHAPLSTLQSTLSDLALDPARPTAVICAGGYRSSAAASILKQHDFKKLLNVSGGTGAWIDAGYPVEIPVTGSHNRPPPSRS